MFESLRVGLDFPELGAPYAGESLAGRSANQNIDCRLDWSEVEFVGKYLRRQFRNVPSLALRCITRMKTPSMGSCGVHINFNCAVNFEACCLEAQGQTAATRKEVEDTRTATARDSGHFIANMAGASHWHGIGYPLKDYRGI
jgi:hypothetical protein